MFGLQGVRSAVVAAVLLFGALPVSARETPGARRSRPGAAERSSAVPVTAPEQCGCAAPELEVPEAWEVKRWRLYVLVSALWSGHLHDASYESDWSLLTGGVGYELGLMVGVRRQRLAFGGAASFVHVPNARSEWQNSDRHESYDLPGERAVFSLLAGPSVDLHASRAFHVGGVVGVVMARAPTSRLSLDPGHDLYGTGVGGWVGFDWSTSEATALGLLLTTHVRTVGPAWSSTDVSLSFGVGASFAYR